MNRAIKASLKYIEEHLTEKITIKDVADVVGYSPFHFQRLFQLMVKTTFGDYIRHRRLTLAAIDILKSRDKIIHIAMKYQYDTPEGFTRAFKKLYGVAPSNIRKADVCLKSYPSLEDVDKISFEPIDYEIVDKKAFYLSGYKRSFTAYEIIQGKAYSKFWQEKEHEMMTLVKDDLVRIGAGRYKDDQNTYDAIIGTFGCFEGLDHVKVEACKWCVFKGKGPVKETLPILWKQIFIEWFPKTSFQHSGKTELELFPLGDLNDKHYEYEIWIPLIKK